MAEEFPSDWTAQVLSAPPLIAPARQVVWPHAIAGEEDALARGAMQVMVRPASGASYLATCALGFRDPSLPSGVWACPDARDLCAVAGGYAYLVRASQPERCTHLDLRPVVEVRTALAAGLLLFAGFHTVTAWGADGLAWRSARLSWEGLRLTEVDGFALHGFGWDLMRDLEVPFTVDLRTGAHTGGGYSVGSARA